MERDTQRQRAPQQTLAEIEAEFTRVVQEAAKVATLKRLALESKAATR